MERRGETGVNALPFRRISPASNPSRPKMALRHSVRPESNQAGDADDFAAADGQVDAVEARGPQAGDPQHFLIRHDAVSGVAVRERAADHVTNDHLNVREPRFMRDHRAIPQDGDLVADRKRVVEIMADIDDCEAAAAKTADLAEQNFALGRRQRRRRLVENNEARIAADGPRNFQQLLSGGAEISHRRGGIQVEAHIGEQRLGALVPVAATKARPDRSQAAEKQVLGHREIIDQGAMLMNHGDAFALPINGGAKAHRPAVEQKLAAVRRINAADDFHQRRLACPILSEQSVNPARKEGHGDAPCGDDPGKGLGDAAQFDEGRRLRHRCLSQAGVAQLISSRSSRSWTCRQAPPAPESACSPSRPSRQPEPFERPLCRSERGPARPWP